MTDSPQPRDFDEPGHTLRFWAIVVGLACLALFAMMWGASSALATKGSEKLLRIGLLLPKLKGNHGDRKADAFRMSEPEPSELAHPKEREIAAPPHPAGAREIAAVFDLPKVTIVEAAKHSGPAPTPEPPRFVADEPGLQPIPDIPRPLSHEEKGAMECTDPVVFLKPCAPARGESPMMRNWKTLTMYSLLTTASVVCAPQPILGQDGKKEPPAPETKKLSEADQEAIAGIIRAEMKKLQDGALADMNKNITKLQLDQLALKIQLEAYKGLVEKLLAGQTPAVDKAFMEELRSSIKSLNETLKAQNETIARLAPSEKRTALYPSNGATNAGRVVIVNLYGTDLLFI